MAKVVGRILNPGGVEAGEASARLSDEQARLLRQLAGQAGTVFGYGKGEYEANQPLIRDMRDRAMYVGSEAGQRSEAGRATADVSRAYTQAKEAEQRDLMRMGANPNDPASRAVGGAGLVRLASAKAGAGDMARRSARNEGYGLTKFLSGRESGYLSGGMQGLSQAASGFGQAAQTAQQDPRQGLFGVPGLSLKRGGAIRAPMGGSVPGEEPMEPGGPGAGIVRDPNPSRTVSMVQGPDGAYSPEQRPPDAGGEITGPGTETSDSIPANLSHGEYVLPAFVGEAMGTPATDALVEMSRQAREGDPMATDDLMKLLKTIAGFKSTSQGVPQRVAGQEPQPPASPTRGVGLGHIKARGGGRIVRRHGMAPVRAAGGGIVDNIMGLVRHRDMMEPSASGSATPVPPSGFPDERTPWWGRFEGGARSERPGQSSVRGIARLAAAAMASKGGHVGAGIYARR